MPTALIVIMLDGVAESSFQRCSSSFHSHADYCCLQSANPTQMSTHQIDLFRAVSESICLLDLLAPVSICLLSLTQACCKTPLSMSSCLRNGFNVILLILFAQHSPEEMHSLLALMTPLMSLILSGDYVVDPPAVISVTMHSLSSIAKLYKDFARRSKICKSFRGHAVSECWISSGL